MGIMSSEWEWKTAALMRTLKDDFYRPLGTISLGGISYHGASVTGRGDERTV